MRGTSQREPKSRTPKGHANPAKRAQATRGGPVARNRKGGAMPFGTGAQAVPWNKGLSKYGPTHQRTVRRYREQDAPGLTYSQRKQLLHRWKVQGRQCTYCTARATTIDHVLPLARGGTNHEGNLVPACKPCNSSKHNKTLMEWKHNRKAPRVRHNVRTKPKPRILKPLWVGPKGKACKQCGKYSGTTYCTYQCFADHGRDSYRITAGIPLDAPDQRRKPRGTHCPNNHPYDADNTKHKANGQRMCRQCHRDARKRSRQRKQATPAPAF